MKLIKQGDIMQFQKETKMFHLEFSSVCNQHCSYCLEGNFDLNKPKCEYSKKEDLLGVLDKIFKAYDENVMLGFILAGGEPTVQPYFIDVVNKIKSRKNAFQILTTNFTQSIEYYKELDIPLVTSCHLDSHTPEAWLEKTLALKDLVAHTRIMAHPQKMSDVKYAYDLFKNSETPFSFAVEEIFGFTVDVQGKKLQYEANYKPEDLNWVRNCKPVDAEYSSTLKNKLGILNNIFYRSQWFYNNGYEEVKIENQQENNFKYWYCECSMAMIKADGTMSYGWGCRDTKVNLYKSKKFPKNEFNTIICNNTFCPLSFGSTIPKYSKIKYAPSYKNKLELFIKRLFHKLIKLLSLFILNKTVRKSFKNKFLK